MYGLVTTILLVLHATYASIEELKCENLPRGFFCLPGLVGVRSCHQPGGEVTVDTPCESGKRCGCGVLRMCSDDEEKCVSLKHPPPIPKNFIARFNGKRTDSNPVSVINNKVIGVVYQDGINGKRLVQTTLLGRKNERRTTMELYVKDKKKGWLKYTTFFSRTSGSNIHRSCVVSKEATDRFPGHFDDLTRYSYHQPGNLWLYKKGPLHPNAALAVKGWTITEQRVKKSNQKFNFPNTEVISDNQGPNAKTDFTINLIYNLVKVPKAFNGRLQGLFRVPKNCDEI